MKLVNALAIPFFKLSGFASEGEKTVAKKLTDTLLTWNASGEGDNGVAEEPPDEAWSVGDNNRPYDEACELDFDKTCF